MIRRRLRRLARPLGTLGSAATLCLVAALLLGPGTASAQEAGAGLADPETVKQWEAFGALLPVAVGAIIGLFKGRLTSSRQAAVAAVVYIAYGLVGNWLAGDFASLGWGTAAEVFASIVKVAAFAQAAYMTLFKLFPLPDYAERATGGEPVSIQRARYDRGAPLDRAA